MFRVGVDVVELGPVTAVTEAGQADLARFATHGLAGVPVPYTLGRGGVDDL